MPFLKLQSNDGEIFEVDMEIAKQSIIMNTMIEDLGIGEDEKDLVPLPNVSGVILRKIVEWCTYHKDDPPPIADDDDNKEKRTDDISSWDANFLKIDKKMLIALINAADYLNIKALTDVACKTVANMIKGKSSDEIRKTFIVKND